MALGNRIIVSPYPKGRFKEIIVVGTPKPGTCMYPTTTADQWEPAGTTAAQGMGADGDMIPVAVLLCFQDHAACPPGVDATTAYVTLDRGAVYFPVMGEEMNVLKADEAGTADDITIGAKLIIDDGTGKLVLTTGTPESEPFVALEAVTDPTADQLLHCLYSGV